MYEEKHLFRHGNRLRLPVRLSFHYTVGLNEENGTSERMTGHTLVKWLHRDHFQVYILHSNRLGNQYLCTECSL